jgi:hypothetical protein
MEDHSGIVFRDGPTGRRAGLAAGPDVWEIISAVRSTGLDGDEAIDATAEWAGLTVRQVRDAVGYYREYPSEIEERIRRNEEGADAAERGITGSSFSTRTGSLKAASPSDASSARSIS